MEEEEIVYPVLKTEEEVNEIVKNKINQRFKCGKIKLYDKRRIFFTRFIVKVSTCKKSWGKADSIVKISGVMIVILGGVTLIVTTCLGGDGIITASGMLIAQSILIGVES